MSTQEHLVVIGNGMAGAKVVEEILERDRSRFRITMFGAEPYGNYNRILLSNVLNGTQDAKEIFMNPLGWYHENDITLHAGVTVTAIDRARKTVSAVGCRLSAVDVPTDSRQPTADGFEERYDRLIIATGSRPFVPPMTTARRHDFA